MERKIFLGSAREWLLRMRGQPYTVLRSLIFQNMFLSVDLLQVDRFDVSFPPFCSHVLEFNRIHVLSDLQFAADLEESSLCQSIAPYLLLLGSV